MKISLVFLGLTIALVMLFLSLPQLYIAIILGPQLQHYYNLILIIFVFQALIMELSQIPKWKVLDKWERIMLPVSIIVILLSIGSSIFYIRSKYGYSSWKYKNFLTL